MIDLWHDVRRIFDGEALSTVHHDISTELWLEWFTCHMISQQCLTVKHCLHSITLVRRNSFQNDWFASWCVRNVRWWSVVYIPSRYFNGTLIKMIDLWHDVRRIFDGEALSTVHHDISTELWLEWFTCHMISQQCLTVKHCLHSITIFQQNSFQNDWFATLCVRNVRGWSVVYIPSRYFNGTLIKMIDLWHDVRRIFDGEALSTVHHDISTELWLEWFTCHMISQQCLTVKHCLHSITLVRRNSFQNDWFASWCVRNVRWWSVVYIRSRYFNGTLIKMIDLWHDVRRIFDGEALSTVHHDISTELWLEWFTCHMISQECSMVKHCLHSITLVRRDSFQNDWFATLCVRNVRWWSIVYIRSH